MNSIDKTKLPIRRYTNDKLLILEEEKQKPIIEGILYQNDYVLLIAEPKVGKSILALQLAANISSGTPFLNTFVVPYPRRIWYFATEGKDEEIKRRLIEINKLAPVNPSNFILYCSAGLRFNTLIGKDTVRKLLELYKDALPKVIFIDALYLAVQGTLKDDGVVNEFNYVIRQFAEKCDATVVIIHHTKKSTVIDGRLIKADKKMEEIFGSIFLPAGADHIFHLNWEQKKGFHSLICESQRSGEVIEDIILQMQEPSPLGFSHIGNYEAQVNPIREYLKNNEKGLTIKEMIKKTNFSRATVYRVLKEIENEVDKSPEYPVVYTLKRH